MTKLTAQAERDLLAKIGTAKTRVEMAVRAYQTELNRHRAIPGSTYDKPSESASLVSAAHKELKAALAKPEIRAVAVIEF